nr:MAG TPA: Protein ygiW [Caudoviricetes sp.]
MAVDTKVRVYGKVLQAMEDGKAYTLRVAINDDYDKIILVSIPSEYNNRVIAEDDHITLYGLVKGRQSYETIFKSTKTLPLMVAYMYEN